MQSSPRLTESRGQIYPPFSLDGLMRGLGAAILNSIRDPLSIVACDYRILWLNKGMASIHGRRHQDAFGKICYEFFYEGSKPCKDCPLDAVFTTGRSNISERYQDFPDGNRRWGEVKAYPIRGTIQPKSGASGRRYILNRGERY